MKNLNEYIYQHINEAKDVIEIGGLKFKEGDRVIYLKTYTDEEGEEWEEEITGTLADILSPQKLNIEFAPKKFVIINPNLLVGLVTKSRTVKFKTSSRIEDKYREELDDINYEINQIMDRMADLNNDMEEDIIDTARQEWLKDNPSKDTNDFDPHSSDGDKYMDKAGSEWAETSGLNDLEKELKSWEKKQEKAQKKLDDYLAKEGSVKTKNGNTKYINGYTPIK